MIDLTPNVYGLLLISTFLRDRHGTGSTRLKIFSMLVRTLEAEAYIDSLALLSTGK